MTWNGNCLCGYDLTGLEQGAVCPECGDDVNRIRAIRANADGRGGRVTRPLRCICDYDLTGIDPAGVCPECGRSIEVVRTLIDLGTPWQIAPSFDSWFRTAWLTAVEPHRVFGDLSLRETPRTLRLNTCLIFTLGAISPPLLLFSCGVSVVALAFLYLLILLIVGTTISVIVSWQIRRAVGVTFGSIEQLYGHAMFPFTVGAIVFPLLLAMSGLFSMVGGSAASGYEVASAVSLVVAGAVLIGSIIWSVAMCLYGGDRLATRLTPTFRM